MALKKKNPPRVADADLNRALQTIYDDLNDIINSVNNSIGFEGNSATGGKIGDFKVVNDDNEYYLQVKTESGWLKVKLNDLGDI